MSGKGDRGEEPRSLFDLRAEEGIGDTGVEADGWQEPVPGNGDRKPVERTEARPKVNPSIVNRGRHDDRMFVRV